MVAASSDDAHRPLAETHSLPASLGYVETRQVNNDYTIQFDNKIYLIARPDIRTGLRGGKVRVEVRLDGSLAVSFRDVYVAVIRMFSTSESGGSAQVAEASRSAQEKPADEQLPSHQPGKDSFVRYSVGISGAGGKRQSVGRAKAARPASRLIYPKTAARELHLSRVTIKNQNPQSWPTSARHWGLVDLCFGASPVAAAFGSASESATSPKHYFQTKPSLQNRPVKPDISTWQDLGHFYLALTIRARYDRACRLARGRPESRCDVTLHWIVMKNWTAIASGNGLNLTDEQLAKITPALNALEAAFRPMIAGIPHAIEPSVTLSEGAVEAQ